MKLVEKTITQKSRRSNNDFKIERELSEKEKRANELSELEGRLERMEYKIKRFPHSIDNWWWKHVVVSIKDDIHNLKNDENVKAKTESTED